MREQSNNEHTLNIRAGLATLKSEYGFHMDEYDYIDVAINNLRDIKHFGATEYVTYLTVDEKGYIDLPCNADIIEAVTAYKMGVKMFQDRVEYEMEGKLNTDDYYSSVTTMLNLGHFYAGLADYKGDGYISYIVQGDKIKLDDIHKLERVAVGFTGISVDSEGYPLITRKQANALAALSAKALLLKAAFKGDKNAANMLQVIMSVAATLKQAASIPENISDNELDELLNAQTTFNRKSYGRPTKYSR